MYYIYRRTCPDGRVYIGCTKNSPNSRAGGQGRNYINNKSLWAAIQQYGWDKFTTDVLATTEDMKEARYLEAAFITKFDATNPLKGFNVSSTPYSDKSSYYTDTVKAEMRVATQERWKDDEYRGKVLDGVHSYWDQPGARERHSAIMKERWSKPGAREEASVKGKAAGARPEVKKKLSELAKDTQWMHRYNAQGQIETCMVKPDLIDAHLADGWVIGRGPVSEESNEKRRATAKRPEVFNANSRAHAGKCCVYRKEESGYVGKQVTPEELPRYLADGWIRGRKPSPKDPRDVLQDKK